MLYFKCLSEFRSRQSLSNNRVFHDWRYVYSAGVNTAKLITFYDKPNVLLIIFQPNEIFIGIRSYLCPVFLPFLKFVIGHIARYAPSSKFQNQQKYRSKLVNLFFHHYLKKYVWKRAFGGWGARNPPSVLLSFLSVSSLPCARRRQSFPLSVISFLIPVSESGSRFVRVCS